MSSYLQGRRVLVVEDEFFLADDMARALGEAGAEVVGPARSEAEALDLIALGDPIDAAVLDINLGDGATFAVAAALNSRQIRFVFATGYSAAILPREHAREERWEKPYNPEDLAKSLAALI